jgi:hypothetical protein
LSDFFEVARQSAMRADTRQTSCGHESPSPAAVESRIFSTKLPPPRRTPLYKSFVTEIKACPLFTVP